MATLVGYRTGVVLIRRLIGRVQLYCPCKNLYSLKATSTSYPKRSYENNSLEKNVGSLHLCYRLKGKKYFGTTYFCYLNYYCPTVSIKQTYRYIRLAVSLLWCSLREEYAWIKAVRVSITTFCLISAWQKSRLK